MKPYILGLAAVGLWACTELPASAAWNNVFQPTLFGRFRRPVTNNYYYAPPVVAQSSPVVAMSAPVVAAAPSPCATGQCGQQCTTSYIQRSYYQPVTTYRTETKMEPVTTYRTSYYQEPVTSYRYSCYYDPCTCSYQQVATPVTSYQLRAQSCPVQSWVARCYQVPVQSYQQVNYWQPQTTCCSTTTGAPVFSNPAVPTSAPTFPTTPPPAIDATRTPTAPSISDGRPAPTSNSPPMYERFYPPITPNSNANPSPPVQPMPPVTSTPRPQAPPQPPVRLEGIAFGPDSRVEGQVVRNDQTPRANAKVMFVNSQTGQRQTINANSAGRFQVELTGGGWLVYLYGADDLPTLADRFEVFGRQSPPLRLVSR